jgi:hypothetical protein
MRFDATVTHEGRRNGVRDPTGLVAAERIHVPTFFVHGTSSGDHHGT